MFTTCWNHRLFCGWTLFFFSPSSQCPNKKTVVFMHQKLVKVDGFQSKLVELTCLSYGQWYLKILYSDIIKSPKSNCMTSVVWVVISEVVSQWSLHIVYLQPWVPMVYVWDTLTKINRRGWGRWDIYYIYSFFFSNTQHSCASLS